MALMELLWAKKITKHSNKIIAATAVKEELGEYITIKVYIYIKGVYKLHLINHILGRIL